MNTPVSPEFGPRDITWLAQTATDTYHYSGEVSWKQLSGPVQLDPGLWVFQTQEPLQSLRIMCANHGLIQVLVAPQPVPFFSLERYAQPLVTGQEEMPRTWLYSVFGYALGDLVVVIRISPTGESEHLLVHRPVAFPW